MYTLISSDKRTASKAHTCIWCGQKIIAGEKYTDERGIYGGNMQCHRWHLECHADRDKYLRESGVEEFTPWENQRPALLNTQANPYAPRKPRPLWL